jgi:hypothetical protein
MSRWTSAPLHLSRKAMQRQAWLALSVAGRRYSRRPRRAASSLSWRPADGAEWARAAHACRQANAQQRSCTCITPQVTSRQYRRES